MLLSSLDLLAKAPGGVTRLRELILTLAVQGKLVPQDGADEPASVLLQKIRAEKDWLIAEGKIKRDKPLAEIAEEEKPFEIPQGWEWVRLGFAAKKITDGTHHSPASFSTGDFKYLSAKNIKTWGIDLSDVTYIPAAVHEEIYTRCDPEVGDILFIKDGATTGILTINTLAEPFSLLSSVGVIKASCGLTSEWLARVMRSPYFYGAMRAEMTGVAITRVTLSKLNVALVPLPPLAEQSRIVTRVEELMRLCDALEAKGRLEAMQHTQLVKTLQGTLTASATPEKLADNWQRVAQHFDLLLDRPEAIDALEQTLLQLAVRGLLVPQDPTDEPASTLLVRIRTEKDRLIAEGKIKRDKPVPPITNEERPFELPVGWEWGRLEQLSIAIVDCPHSTPRFVESGRLCLDTNSFKRGVLLPHKLRFVDDATFVERNIRLTPQPGDLVFAREGSVGESILIPDGVEACLGQRVMLFRFSSQVSKEFVRLAISSRSFLDSLLAMHKGIGAKHVNVGDMRNAVIPLPPLTEQSRIVTRVNALRRLCADLRQRLMSSQVTQSHLARALVESSNPL
ncbi:restriction endonuclease subunit S [Variovorax sp.]|jgi:type I restriction enzyme, S subunit|uniref:restriction endonuclease subunit S n=1 Tax=Variovorax sp. TaxID=1871043 RepID=UPI00120AC05E|nr:restriction endonuclease subunit S [Variovorax sp.]TAJ66524.1 MAG: restriction endonuclease subunit S [Variovorax sp.]